MLPERGRVPDGDSADVVHDEDQAEPATEAPLAVVEQSLSGKPRRRVACESAEAATHWDLRLWRRGT